MALGRHPGAGAAVGAPASRRARDPRLQRARRRLRDRLGDRHRGGRRGAPPDPRSGHRLAAGGDRRRREPLLAAPPGRHARGGHPPRDPAAANRPLVARAPAHLPAPGDARGAHQGRRALARETAPAPALAAPTRRRPVQGPPRAPGRLRRGRGLGGGRGDRRRARRDRRRDRLHGRDLLLAARPPRARRELRADRQADLL